MGSIEELKKQIAEYEHKLEQANRQLILLNESTGLATKLHDLLCKFNHTDGCGWFYEFSNGEPNWNMLAHA